MWVLKKIDTGAIECKAMYMCTRVKLIVLGESPGQVRELMEGLGDTETEQLVWTYIQSPATLSDMAEFIPDTRYSTLNPNYPGCCAKKLHTF